MKQETLPANGASGTRKYWYAVAVIAVLVVVWYGVGKSKHVTPKENSAEVSSDVPLVLAGNNSIAVDDQVSGSSVLMKSINLESDAWLVVYEDKNGERGNILGAAWFPSGASEGAIELERPTVDGATYYVVIHSDTMPRNAEGHKVFDFKSDLPMTDDSGNVLMTKFMTTATPAVQQ